MDLRAREHHARNQTSSGSGAYTSIAHAIATLGVKKTGALAYQGKHISAGHLMDRLVSIGLIDRLTGATSWLRRPEEADLAALMLLVEDGC